MRKYCHLVGAMPAQVSPIQSNVVVALFFQGFSMIQSMPQAKTPPSIKSPPVTRFAPPASVPTPIQSAAVSSAGALTTVVTHDDIAQRAHDIYVKNGFQQGQSDQNWQQAERDLRDHGTVACHAEHR